MRLNCKSVSSRGTNLQFTTRVSRPISGGGGIRTHEPGLPATGFQDRRIQPLCHPSGLGAVPDLIVANPGAERGAIII